MLMEFIKENLKIMKKMDLEFLISKIRINIKEIGKIKINMVKGNLL